MMHPDRDLNLLVTECRPALVQFARARGLSSDEAEDVAGDVWACVWVARGRIRDTSKSGVHQFARKALINELSHRFRRRSSWTPLDDLEAPAPASVNPASRYAGSDLNILATSLRDRCLHPKDRDFLRLWTKHGSHQVMAQLLHITEAASRQRLSRIQRRLRSIAYPDQPPQSRFGLPSERARVIAEAAGIPTRLVIHICTEQDWSDPDHQSWLDHAPIAEIVSWVLANLEP